MLPKGWIETTVGNVLKLKYGKALPDRLRIDGPVPVYGSNGIVGTHTESLTDGETIVVGRKGSAGKVQRSLTGCYPIDTTYYVDDFSTIEPGFATSLLNTLGLDKMDRATAIPGLNREDAYKLPVLIPPLAEQRRIVVKLDALALRLARARTELDRIQVLADRLRRRASVSAFEGTLTADWRSSALIHEPVSDQALDEAYFLINGGERRKPCSQIEWRPNFDLPKSWRWVSVDQVVALVQYGSSSKTSEDTRGVPVLRMGNIQRGEIDWRDLKYLPQDHDEFPTLLLDVGDIVFNRTNSFELVGKSAVCKEMERPTSFASYLIRLRSSGILPELLAIYLNSPLGRAWVESVASQQVGQANVSGSKLKALGIPLPPFDEQAEMLRRLQFAFSRANRLEGEATRSRKLLGRLESAILMKAFKGELVPQDPNEEPAGALLERIRADRAMTPSSERNRKGHNREESIPLERQRISNRRSRHQP